MLRVHLLSMMLMKEIRFKPIETQSLINNTPGGRSGIIALKCNWIIK